jgi:hypothetical protein
MQEANLFEASQARRLRQKTGCSDTGTNHLRRMRQTGRKVATIQKEPFVRKGVDQSVWILRS